MNVRSAASDCRRLAAVLDLAAAELQLAHGDAVDLDPGVELALLDLEASTGKVLDALGARPS